MDKKCKLICMSFDGDYVTEHPRGFDTFDSIESAWEHDNDMGSRWFFYPFHFVVNASGLTVIDTAELLEVFKGKRVNTVAREFERVSKLPEALNMDCDNFSFLLLDQVTE
jgi:hypothetical protein